MKASTSPMRQTLMDTALHLLCTKGYNKLSYADLAVAVGLRKASIHYHFPAKVDLGLALMEQQQERLEQQLQSIQARYSHSQDKLKAFSALFTQPVAEYFPLCSVLATEMGCLPEPMQEATQSFIQGQLHWLTQVIETGQQNGEILTPGPAAGLAFDFLSLLEGACLLKRSLPLSPTDLSCTVERLFAFRAQV